MKTFFGIITGILTVLTLICTMFWKWIGIGAGLYIGVTAFTSGSGIIWTVFSAVLGGVTFAVLTFLLGIILTVVFGSTTNSLLK